MAPSFTTTERRKDGTVLSRWIDQTADDVLEDLRAAGYSSVTATAILSDLVHADATGVWSVEFPFGDVLWSIDVDKEIS